MPKISQLEAPEGLGLRPSETGINAVAAAARRVGTEYTEAAAALKETGQHYATTIGVLGEFAVKYADHQQISAGAAESIKLLDTLNKSKDERIAKLDKTDAGYGIAVESVTKDWRENTLEPALQRFKAGFTTENSQKWAESFVEKTREHMFHQTAADSSNASGIAVGNSVKTISSIASNLALRDPGQVEMLIGTPARDGQPAKPGKIDTDLSAIVNSSNLKGVNGAKVFSEQSYAIKKSIVMSGAQGAIEQSSDPEKTAREWTDKYPEYIDGAHARRLGKDAVSQNRTNLLTQHTIDRYEREEVERGQKNALAKVQSDNVSYDENGKITIKPGFFAQAAAIGKKYDNTKHEGVGAHEATVLQQWGADKLKEKPTHVVTDEATKAARIAGMYNPDNPTTTVQIYEDELAGKISSHDGVLLRGMITSLNELPKGPRMSAAIKAVEEAVGAGALPDGHGRFNRVMETFLPQYQAALKAGKVPDGALDTTNPESMISKAIGGFRLTGPELINANIARRQNRMGDPTLFNPEAERAKALKRGTPDNPISKDDLPADKDLEKGEVYTVREWGGPRQWKLDPKTKKYMWFPYKGQ